MDAIAGLAFGIVVVNVIRQMGVDDDTAIAKEVLTLRYPCRCFNGSDLYLKPFLWAHSLWDCSLFLKMAVFALSQISSHYLGRAGLVILAVTITFACLKTSIGLVTSCSETFVQMFPDKLSYKAWAIIYYIIFLYWIQHGAFHYHPILCTVLMLIYPPAIALILLAMFGEHFHHERKV